ncbi:MAG TPA: phage holin family protein [Solirubrobacteraceae bacterium]|jgi:Flp pilus assembly protein TadB|nr:phage holin family protein [Solirubrobacteraceae bacterium]
MIERASDTSHDSARANDDRSAAELIKQVSEQTSKLVRQEIALARLEIREKIKHFEIGAGLLGAAAFFALFGAATLIAALVLVLATAMEAWLAALVVAVVLLAGAGIMALGGKRQIAEATPPAPEQAVENVQADIEEVKRSVRA